MSQDGQQSILDRTVILGQVKELKTVVEEFKGALAKTNERIAKAEVEVGVLRAGCEVMFHALELNGLLVSGEPARISGSKPSSEKELAADSEKLSPKETRPNWNPSGMEWVEARGGKGPYQKSEDVDSPDFKEMLKDLAAHKGKLYRNGLFYWTFPSGTTVGRKQVKRA